MKSIFAVFLCLCLLATTTFSGFCTEQKIKCPKCEFQNTPKGKFCSKCGAELKEAPKWIFCPKCHLGNPLGSKFCKDCGASLKAEDEQPKLVVPTKTYGYTDGTWDADMYHSSGIYFGASFLSGILISPLLCGGITLIVAASSNPEPQGYFANKDKLESLEYRQGYWAKARTKNMNNTLYGFLSSWAVNLLILSAIMNQ